MSPTELDLALKDLMDRGMVYLTWKEEENDFGYGLTEKGIFLARLVKKQKDLEADLDDQFDNEGGRI